MEMYVESDVFFENTSPIKKFKLIQKFLVISIKFQLFLNVDGGKVAAVVANRMVEILESPHKSLLSSVHSSVV